MINRRLFSFISFVFSALALAFVPEVVLAQGQFFNNTPDLTPFQMLDIMRSQGPTAVDVNALAFQTQVLERHGVVLVEFMLPTCSECDPVLRLMKTVVSKYEGSLGYLRLDIDKNPGLGEKYDVPRVPAILVFKDGKLIKKFMVFNTAQKDVLARTIDEQFKIPAKPAEALAASDSSPVK